MSATYQSTVNEQADIIIVARKRKQTFEEWECFYVEELSVWIFPGGFN